MSEAKLRVGPLTRAQMLREIGLTTLWQLRQRPPGEAVEAAPEQGSPIEDETAPDAQAPVAKVCAPDERAAAIAAMDWEQLRESVAGCRACVLCERRRQAVLGVGDLDADWLFVGEGPGEDEDRRGEPFVGTAGRLLDAMLRAIDLRRGEDVYIANAVKCRPPGNRTPDASEIDACLPYLRRQIALLQPRLIVLLGRAAVRAVLGNDGSLASLRGRSFGYCAADGSEPPIPVLVTYHPAYLLRTLPDKAKAWEDLCRARALMRAVRDQAQRGDGTPEAG
ncbi:uracil-DNA glycosylase family protein [Accumulibacter sp.]|uniref:uracil-DNA glycosylase n=1 Tax=Accumulibacter sp. TaxID=2053492 RepID=UPI0025FBA32E|nr:uracil-DNA glycosylase [Accumulibacter sp.]MCM8594923.1 uracil-DNA glycosylase [Accumulibacter sp.]MCM8627134.1 uracil-DNA glycosylase [Accumulibacter sp.]MDS4049069.1 uracil-DNA glycosylase [Accumulibacter sp.]